jgi:sulfide:quinone oxidoreductase
MRVLLMSDERLAAAVSEQVFPIEQRPPSQRRRETASRRVLIAGAGVAGLEALLALRAQAEARVAIRVLAPGEAFLHWPTPVAEAFERAHAAEADLGALLRSAHAARTVDLLTEVDADARTVRTRSGERIAYDDLVVAVGARPVPAVHGALAFRGHADVPAFRHILEELEARRISRIAFAFPRTNAWPVPLYELALMCATRMTALRLPGRISIVTAEAAPLERFGPLAGEALGELLEASGIELHLGRVPVSFHSGTLSFEDGGAVRVDRVLALPRLLGQAIDGLPSGPDGFVPIDRHGRVPELDGIHAAGDATAYSLKNGGLATAQAEAVAEDIAASAGAPVEPRPFPTIVRGLLLADPEPLYVRIEAMRRNPEPRPAQGEGPPPHAGCRRSVETQLRTGTLWWPPPATAGRYLAPHADAGARSGRSSRRARGSVALTLLMADRDAWAGDHAMALRALDCAESLGGPLSSHYLARRRRWRQALAADAPQE